MNIRDHFTQAAQRRRRRNRVITPIFVVYLVGAIALGVATGSMLSGAPSLLQ